MFEQLFEIGRWAFALSFVIAWLANKYSRTDAAELWGGRLAIWSLILGFIAIMIGAPTAWEAARALIIYGIAGAASAFVIHVLFILCRSVDR